MERIKIYGERNTGTKYLEWLINKNLGIEPDAGFRLGWKHRLIPEDPGCFEKDSPDTLFICMTKNPYSWLLSMHKRPLKHMMLRKTRFVDFLNYSFGDYINPVELWNKKNHGFLYLEKMVKYYHLMRYEDLLDDPEGIIRSIAEKYGYKMPYFFKNIKNKLTHDNSFSKHKFHKEYYLEEKWKFKLSGREIEIINQYLDHALMKHLNYEIL